MKNLFLIFLVLPFFISCSVQVPAQSSSRDTSRYIYNKKRALAHAEKEISARTDDMDMRVVLKVINRHEGHGFVIAEGSKSIKTDDGITWGVLGFTSFNKELYHVLDAGLKRVPAGRRADFAREADKILSVTEGDSKPTSYAEFEKALRTGLAIHPWKDARPNANDPLANWGLKNLPDKKRIPWSNVEAFFGWLGNQKPIVDEQWLRISSKYAYTTNLAKRALKGGTPSLRAKMLFMDMYTFSSGISSTEWKLLEQMKWGTEEQRLRQCTDIVLERLKANGSRYEDDCRRRWDSIIRMDNPM